MITTQFLDLNNEYDAVSLAALEQAMRDISSMELIAIGGGDVINNNI
jgi:hypothetical protein